MRLSVLAVLCLLGAAPLHAQPAESPEARAVRETLRAMWDALAANDLAGYAAHVHPDYSSFGENDVYLTEGKDAELRGYRSYLDRVTNLRTDMQQPKVTVRGNTAWITYYWTESAVDGGARSTSRGKATRIFVREGGRWLCIHAHFTAVP